MLETFTQPEVGKTYIHATTGEHIIPREVHRAQPAHGHFAITDQNGHSFIMDVAFWRLLVDSPVLTAIDVPANVRAKIIDDHMASLVLSAEQNWERPAAIVERDVVPAQQQLINHMQETIDRERDLADRLVDVIETLTKGDSK